MPDFIFYLHGIIFVLSWSAISFIVGYYVGRWKGRYE